VLFCVLLALDIVWSYLTTEFLARESQMPAQKAWRHINLVAVVALLGVLIAPSVTETVSTERLWSVILAVALLRTAADYVATWRFYAAASA
jgi:hypothetical protein